MRGRSQMSEIPVVVVTAKDLTEDERDFLSGRVENVLQKGAYTRHQLLGLIKVALADLAQG
jgi:CheY-like chemotaxis protein